MTNRWGGWAAIIMDLRDHILGTFDPVIIRLRRGRSTICSA
jgi:hypothetical protein